MPFMIALSAKPILVLSFVVAVSKSKSSIDSFDEVKDVPRFWNEIKRMHKR